MPARSGALDSRSVAACAVLLPRQEVPCSVDASARRRRPPRPLARPSATPCSPSWPSARSTSAPSSAWRGSAPATSRAISDDHRCYAFGDPAPLSAEQQTRVCQERGYGNCPRYLRGVLVIPTEELEALRRPRAPLAEPPRPARRPAGAAASPRRAAAAPAAPAARRRRRRGRIPDLGSRALPARGGRVELAIADAGGDAPSRRRPAPPPRAPPPSRPPSRRRRTPARPRRLPSRRRRRATRSRSTRSRSGRRATRCSR